jgi:hypothetical protein
MRPDKIGIPVKLGDDMSFPDWAHSYNALYVALRYWNWHCMLMPASEAQADGSFWSSLTYEARENKRQERKQQIERDKEDFQRLFSLRIDRCEARRSSDFSLYTDFIRDVLRVTGWGLPVDGKGVTRVLRDAVRDGLLVPAINREWQGGQRVFKHYAPQYWKNPVGGGASVKASSEVMQWDDFVALKRVNGELPALERESYGGGQGFDWFGAAEAVAGTMLGDGASSRDDVDGSSMPHSFGDSGGSSLLADAQPFDYQPDAPSEDPFDLAGMPYNGDPGWAESGPNQKKQWRMYGANGTPVVDIDFDDHHGQPNPHAHNWDSMGRDHGWPVSVFPR